MIIRFERNGKENGKSSYLVKRKIDGTWVTQDNTFAGVASGLVRTERKS